MINMMFGSIRNWTTGQKRLVAVVLGILVVAGLSVSFIYYGSLGSKNVNSNSEEITDNSSAIKSGGDIEEKTNEEVGNNQSTSSGDSRPESSSNEASPPPSGSSSDSASTSLQPVLTTISNSKSVSPLTVGFTTASCPSGTKPFGGGFRSLEEKTRFLASYMTESGWYVKATNTTTAAVNIFAYVQCVSNVPGSVSTIVGSTTIASGASGTLNKDCPTGQTVVSGGYDSSQNDLDITFSARVNNGWRVNAVNSASSIQGLRVLTSCYSGGTINITQTLETDSAPAGWTWTKVNACDSGLAIMGGFASNARNFQTYYLTTNSKWSTAVYNTGTTATNFKAYFYCASF